MSTLLSNEISHQMSREALCSLSKGLRLVRFTSPPFHVLPNKGVDSCIVDVPILSYDPLSFSILSSSSSSSSITSTATGGYLSLGGSGSPGPGKGVSVTTSVVHGGWLSTGDGSTTYSSSSSTPPSQPTTVGPASNQVSQPTPPPVVGGSDTVADPLQLRARHHQIHPRIRSSNRLVLLHPIMEDLRVRVCPQTPLKQLPAVIAHRLMPLWLFSVVQASLKVLLTLS